MSTKDSSSASALSQQERIAKAKAAAAKAKALKEQGKLKTAKATEATYKLNAQPQAQNIQLDMTNTDSKASQLDVTNTDKKAHQLENVDSLSQKTDKSNSMLSEHSLDTKSQKQEALSDTKSSNNEIKQEQANLALNAQSTDTTTNAIKPEHSAMAHDVLLPKDKASQKKANTEKTDVQSLTKLKDRSASSSAKRSSKKLEDADSSTVIEGKKAEIPKLHQPSLFEIFIKGIWKENPGLCQLLGMCPLLAVTNSAANALGLGIATIVVMVLSSMVISLLRHLIMPEVRIPLYVMIIATLVTVVRIEVEAYFPSLYQQLGIYLSLIVTNCIIMARAEAFAGKNNIIRSTVDAIACSIGFTLVLFALGCVREIIGNGTLFMGAADVLGDWALGLETQVMSADNTLLIAILPPGGFFVLAMFIALKNFLDSHAKRRAERKLQIRALKL